MPILLYFHEVQKTSSCLVFGRQTLAESEFIRYPSGFSLLLHLLLQAESYGKNGVFKFGRHYPSMTSRIVAGDLC